MADTYKRAVFVGPKQIRFDDVPVPHPGPRQVVVKVKACALCTWEQRMYTGEEHFYPLAGGHEVAGELVEVGTQVYTDAKIGDRVMAGPLTRCGYCESCRRGLDNICDNSFKRFRDTDVPGPAGLAEYILLEDYQLYKAGNDVSFEEISLSEPVACVMRSIRQANLQRGDDVVILGAGIMGLLHVTLAKMASTRVIVSEPNPERAAFARKMGADDIIDPLNEDFVERVKALTGGRGANHLFTAVSIASAVEQAVAAAAKGGRIAVYASIHPKPAKITIDPNPFHGKEITLTGTMSQDKEDVRQAVKMISAGLIDLKPFISLTLPLEKLEEGLQAALRPDTYRVIMTM
ncbi:MAG: zinc-binding dehydrogenase [Anaerolineae bacterium]|nr:zinc-binding dehydrogenase [Anaerolineae bacterium]